MPKSSGHEEGLSARAPSQHDSRAANLHAPTTGLSNGNGSARGRGRTNGGGLTNGGGRTNGSSGLTNGSGRTNGSGGFTNGSGRTNGSSGRITGRRAMAYRTERRSRRRTFTAVAAVVVVAVTLGAALGLAGPGGGSSHVDGSLADWPAGLLPAPSSSGAPLLAFGVHETSSGTVAAFDFEGPVTGRADIWVFLDTDRDGTTGYYAGGLGADAAVVVRADGGRVLASSTFRFMGDDPFDLNGLAVVGRAPAALRDALLEVQLPAVPQAMSVAVASATGASSSGAFDLTGQSVLLPPPSAPQSGLTRNGILIDGRFGDWSGVPRVAEPQSNDLPGRLDIESAVAIGDDESAQFYLSARGEILTGTLPLRASPIAPAQAASLPANPSPPRRTAGTDLLEVYIDADSDAATGATAYGLGAEHLLRVEGVGGYVVSAQAFTFIASQGWVDREVSAEAAASGGELELSVLVPGLVGGDARFVLQGFEGTRDVSSQEVTVGQMSGASVPVGGLSTQGASPETPEPSVSPIPEISNVMAISAGVLGILLIQRRLGKRAGSKRGA